MPTCQFLFTLVLGIKLSFSHLDSKHFSDSAVSPALELGFIHALLSCPAHSNGVCDSSWLSLALESHVTWDLASICVWCTTVLCFNNQRSLETSFLCPCMPRWAIKSTELWAPGGQMRAVHVSIPSSCLETQKDHSPS